MKKLLSICLAAILLFSVAVVPASANNGEKTLHTLEQAMAYWEEELGEEIPTRTLYFYFRDDWKFESNDYYDASVGLESCLPSVYWWGSSTFNTYDYPPYDGRGLILTDEVAPNVYKAEIPMDAEFVIWDNSVDGGEDKTSPIYLEAIYSEDMTIGYADCDLYGFYPDGIPKDNFDNMIFVIDENNSTSSSTPIYLGSWFYYYGNGEYGIKPTKEEAGEYVYSNGEFPIYELDVIPNSVKIEVGEKITIETDKTDVSAVSDNNEIVTVVPKNEENSEFILTGVSLGETQVTFSYYSGILEKTVTETMKVSVAYKPKFAEKVKKLSAGETATLTIENQGEDPVLYFLSDYGVIDVDDNGKITALSKGNVTITAYVGYTELTELTCKVKVKNNPKLVNSDGKKVKAVTVKKGKKVTLLLEGKAKSIKNVYKNSKKAKIVSGKNAKKIKIKGLKRGTSKVSVKVNDVKTLTVKVKVV